MLKNKKAIFVLGGCVFLSVIIFISLGMLKEEQFDKYLVIQSDIVFKDIHYIQLAENLSAVQLGKQIGVTDKNQQIYEIEGQNSDEWICLRNDGAEWVYRNRNIQFLTIDRFATDKILIKDTNINGSEQKTIIDKEAIEVILGDLLKENLSNSPEYVDTTKVVNLFSDKFPGLCFSLIYLHDNENGNCFLYDYNTEEFWVIGHELMKQLM